MLPAITSLSPTPSLGPHWLQLLPTLILLSQTSLVVQTTMLVLQPSTVQDPAIAVVLVCRHVSDSGGGDGGMVMYLCVWKSIDQVSLSLSLPLSLSPSSLSLSLSLPLSLSLVPCAPVRVSVTTVLYQNNSVYGVELSWGHSLTLQQLRSCGVPLYSLMVTSDASTDMATVDTSYCSDIGCYYNLLLSAGNVSSFNVSVACRNSLNQTGQPYVTTKSELVCWPVSLCRHGYLPIKVYSLHLGSKLVISM